MQLFLTPFRYFFAKQLLKVKNKLNIVRHSNEKKMYKYHYLLGFHCMLL